MRIKQAILSGLSVFVTGIVQAEEPVSTPRPIPLTRDEMKQLLEDMKTRKPRIPLPELTAADKEKLGDRGNGYEGRLRYHYMQGGDTGAFGFGGGGASGGRGTGGRGAGNGGAATANPEYSLDNTFKVQLFWIVCRANNCQYCQGHQENKLLRAGQKEDQIAALDGDWSEFSPAERTAFAFARKITYEPYKIGDVDIEGLRKHYKDAQILEMMLSIAGNNAINRWKEGTGVPQSENGGGFGGGFGGGNRDQTEPPAKHTYVTPTSAKYKDLVTKVAPLMTDEKSGQPTRATVCRRPALESREDTEKSLAAVRSRNSRLPLASEESARKLLTNEFGADPLPEWVRLLATFPTAGKNRILSQVNSEEKGDLTKLLKAQASWVIARQDRAWYAAGLAKQRLLALGQTEDQIYQLDGDAKDLSAKDRSLLKLAKNLAASPVVLTDDEVADAVKLAGPRDVVQMINYVTTRASFDRITEAAGLRLEH